MTEAEKYYNKMPWAFEEGWEKERALKYIEALIEFQKGRKRQGPEDLAQAIVDHLAVKDKSGNGNDYKIGSR